MEAVLVGPGGRCAPPPVQDVVFVDGTAEFSAPFDKLSKRENSHPADSKCFPLLSSGDWGALKLEGGLGTQLDAGALGGTSLASSLFPDTKRSLLTRTPSGESDLVPRLGAADLFGLGRASSGFSDAFASPQRNGSLFGSVDGDKGVPCSPMFGVDLSKPYKHCPYIDSDLDSVARSLPMPPHFAPDGDDDDDDDDHSLSAPRGFVPVGSLGFDTSLDEHPGLGSWDLAGHLTVKPLGTPTDEPVSGAKRMCMSDGTSLVSDVCETALAASAADEDEGTEPSDLWEQIHQVSQWPRNAASPDSLAGMTPRDGSVEALCEAVALSFGLKPDCVELKESNGHPYAVVYPRSVGYCTDLVDHVSREERHRQGVPGRPLRVKERLECPCCFSQHSNQDRFKEHLRSAKHLRIHMVCLCMDESGQLCGCIHSGALSNISRHMKGHMGAKLAGPHRNPKRSRDSY
jgi:hypothetical protein